MKSVVITAGVITYLIVSRIAFGFDLDMSPRDVYTHLNFQSVDQLAARVPVYLESPYFCHHDGRLFLSVLTGISEAKTPYKATKDIDGKVSLNIELLTSSYKNDEFVRTVNTVISSFSLSSECNQYMTIFSGENIIEVKSINGKSSLSELLASSTNK